MSASILLVPPVASTILSPGACANWLATQLRGLGRFASSPTVAGDALHSNDREYHRFVRTFPFVDTWEQAQQVVESFGCTLVPSPVMYLPSEYLVDYSLTDESVAREVIVEALISTTNAFFDSDLTDLDLALDNLRSRQVEPGSIMEAKLGHPILEALEWIDIVPTRKLVLFLNQYVIISEKVNRLDLVN